MEYTTKESLISALRQGGYLLRPSLPLPPHPCTLPTRVPSLPPLYLFLPPFTHHNPSHALCCSDCMNCMLRHTLCTSSDCMECMNCMLRHTLCTAALFVFRLSITIHSIHPEVIQMCRGVKSRSTIHTPTLTIYTLTFLHAVPSLQLPTFANLHKGPQSAFSSPSQPS